MAAKDNLRRDQFFIKPSSSRYAGPQGLAEWVGMDDPDEANDAIAQAKGYTASTEADVPIGRLMAVHDINREHARDIMKSIKSKGFDPEERIEVLSDNEGGGVILEGHHRAIAARAAGMRTIPAHVWDPNDIESTIETLRSYR